MRRRIAAIASNTLREALRNRILYTILLFACLLILSGLVVGELSLGEQARVARDLGLGGISLFGVVLATLLGVDSIHKEIDRRTIYLILSKPLRRSELVMGKFAGIALALALEVGLMTAVLAVAVHLAGARFDALLGRAVVLLYLQAAVVAAIAVLLSTVATPMVAVLGSFGLFAIGRSLPDLLALVARIETPALRAIARGAVELLPDLHVFFVSGTVVGGEAMSVNATGASRYVDWGYVGWAGGYAAIYCAAVLGLAAVIFSRRDLV